ncbi:hypothetical protein BDZ91DRAFT_736118 [Kalaharituber pfeilii]|nr:hypothetical protein BDZ91DRAFT_736118 [Kalaharituber pfeilii]
MNLERLEYREFRVFKKFGNLGQPEFESFRAATGWKEACSSRLQAEAVNEGCRIKSLE